MSPRRPQHQLQLVAPRPSEATVNKLRELLQAAERGELVGLAFVALSARNFTVDAVGQANERPTLARGMLQVLDDLLRDRQKIRRT